MCWHKWNDWAIVESGDVLGALSNDRLGSYILQERFCAKCGKHGINMQRAGSSSICVTYKAREKRPKQPQKAL